MIEELKCDSNAGFKLIPAFEVVVSRNKVTVDLGTLTDEYEKEITIHTTATDKKTGEKMIVAGKDIKIVDKVTLDGLEVGTKYKLSGWQMLKEENAELLIDGKRVDNANYRGADVDWYVKADDIVLKNKGTHAGNPQNNAPQQPPKK